MADLIENMLLLSTAGSAVAAAGSAVAAQSSAVVAQSSVVVAQSSAVVTAGSTIVAADTTNVSPVRRRKACRASSTSRALFSRPQVARLEARFREQSFLSKEERQELARHVGITERQVMIWFQNRR